MEQEGFGLVHRLLYFMVTGEFMKKLLMILTIVGSQNVFAAELTDALSAAIQSSDSEKSTTKIALLVAEDHIEKATFKRGQQKQVLQDMSTVLADNTYSVPVAKNDINTEEKSQIEALEKELGDKK
jgi:hypothetical protein